MQRLELLAGQGELTNLPKRLSIRARMDALWEAQAIRLAMTDLDHFKHIKDRFGHETGDRALVAFALLLKQHAVDPESCARLGGEEFALLILEDQRTCAITLCASLCNEMAAKDIESVNGGGLPLHYQHRPFKLGT